MEIDMTEEVPPSSQNDQLNQIVPEQLMNGDEDPYKPEGHITLKIEKFGEFAREGSDSRRLSDAVYIRGLPWKILAIPRELGRRTQMALPQKCLGYFLQCNADNTDAGWSCAGTAVLKILAQKEGKEDHIRKISHVFHAKENDWGFAQFMTFESLMDNESGWYDENTDSIILSVDVTADAPHGVNWDSKKDTGYIGLKNQGATCYMNSILQTLFFTNKLRKAVYQMPTEDDNPESSVALAMQRVFFELQFSESPVGTKKLTKSFGWDSIDSFLQHDVQEFCRVLLDNLENKMKNTKVLDTIPSLFKGRMKSYIKCKDVDFESSREECFYDLQLNVKNKSNVLESFKDYIELEILDGENKYDAGDYGLQPAEKGLKFLSFPPVLHLQLMRFQYDPLLDANVKINDKFEFPEILDLNEFIDDEGCEKDDYSYLLHAVLVHSGDFHGGHYVAFINTKLKGSGKWCKFDDDVVSRVTYRDAVAANFGGENPEGMGRSYTNAYMLVYIKKNSIEKVLCPVSAIDIPEHLKIRFDNEKQREKERRMEREEANNYCEITLVLDEVLKAHHEFELFDTKILEIPNKKMKVQKNMTFRDLYKFIADNLKVPENSFRLWDFQEVEDRNQIQRFRSENMRPRNFIDPNDNNENYEASFVRYDRNIYLEMGNLSSNGEYLLKPYDRASDVFVFIKFFNAERKLTEFKGTLIINMANDVFSHVDEINMIIGQAPGTRLNLYVEYKPDRIVPIPEQTMKTSPLNQDGLILIAEKSDDTSEQNAQKYFFNLYNLISAEAHVNVNGIGYSKLNNAAAPIKGQISLNWNLPRVCDWIAKEIDYNLDKILLWKVAQPSEKPFIYVTSDQYREYKVSQLLSLNNSINYDPRLKRTYKLFYSKLPIPFTELENRTHLLLQMLHDDFQISEISVFPRRRGTVRDILEEAKNEFQFSQDGTGLLRLVYIYSSANCARVFHVLNEDLNYNDILEKNTSAAYMLRVEEIPKDQLEIGAGEHLFPVAHFDKDPARMFGVPFFVKISNVETIKEVKSKIREIMHVSEKEFEKYKFHIVMNNQVVRDLNEDVDNNITIENLGEFLNAQTPTINAEPYLGIDYLNKIRTQRGSLIDNKPIIIHN